MSAAADKLILEHLSAIHLELTQLNQGQRELIDRTGRLVQQIARMRKHIYTEIRI